MWPDPDSLTIGQVLLAGVALFGFVGFAVAFLPPLASFLGLTRVRFTAIDDPAAVEDVSGDEEYQRLRAGLAELGYRPAGVVGERMWFQGYEWYYSARVRKFRAADGRTFAAIYRLRDAVGPWRLAFETVCEGGFFVQTAAPGVGLHQLSGAALRAEVGQLDAAAVETYHRKVLAQVAVAGGPRPTTSTLAEHAAVGERVDEATVRAPGSLEPFTLPALVFGIPAVVLEVFRLAALSLLDWPAAPVVVEVGVALAGGFAAYLAAMRYLVPVVFTQIEDCDYGERTEAPPADLEPFLAEHFKPVTVTAR